MSSNELSRHTLSVLVENAAGVLSQVSRLFSRKGYNIESLAVGTTDDPAVSRITIELLADQMSTEQIMNQLRKLFTVYSVQELMPERSIRRNQVRRHAEAAVGFRHSGAGAHRHGSSGTGRIHHYVGKQGE